MSIYATLWKLKFPKDGDDYPGCEWITVTAQGVPAHIGSPTPGSGYKNGDPFAAFLPPPVRTNENDEADYVRAVVFVTELTPKGTQRSAQEYVDMTFETLYARICQALRGDKPKAIATSVVPGRRVRIFFEDGTDKEVDA